MTEHNDALDTPEVRPLHLSPTVLALVFVGGLLGTMARYLLDTAHPTSSGHFPCTTLAINLSGSLAIGFMIPLAEKVHLPHVRSFAVVGFLGGWTTFSTLAVDAVLLTKGSHLASALLYLAATLLGGVLLVVVGDAAGHQVVDR